jgi:hypothetical protein
VFAVRDRILVSAADARGSDFVILARS